LFPTNGCEKNQSKSIQVENARKKMLERKIKSSCPRQLLRTRVARWHIFKPKIHILGKFSKVLLWKIYWYMYYSDFFYFTAIWYSLWPFGTFCGYLVYFFLILVCCTNKNLATLLRTPFCFKITPVFVFSLDRSECTLKRLSQPDAGS
jgi:hypothetical protein